jgi:hypothetical protein
MIGGRRFDVEDIDSGSGNAAGPQRRDQIPFDHHRNSQNEAAGAGFSVIRARYRQR